MTDTGIASPAAKPFGLVLCGGGGRGLAHAGVLRALGRYGYHPSAVVGVSMGAWVAVTYALNDAWYPALLALERARLPAAPRTRRRSLRARLTAGLAAGRLVKDVLLGWGSGERYLTRGRALLRRLTRDRLLEEGRVPVAAVATDLRSGARAVLESGSAVEAAYASSALAGFLPPVEWGGQLLADGGYADLAPVDVARRLGAEAVIAVDPDQAVPVSRFRNGLEVMVRAVDICNREHTRLRLARADLVLRPPFRESIETLDFTRVRECAAAGARAVRRSLPEIRRLLQE